MDNLDAIAIIENVGPETDEDSYLTAFQKLIDNGLVWSRTHWHRQAVDLISTGRCRDTYNTLRCNPHAR